MSGPELPIDEALPALRAALDDRPAVVLEAPPGAGKTTRVPLDVLQAPWLKDQKIKTGLSSLLMEISRLLKILLLIYYAALRHP